MRQITARLLVALSALTFGVVIASAQTRSFSTVPMRSTQQPLLLEDFGSIIIGPNVNITNKTGAQSETGVAVDPTNPMHILTSVNDLVSTAAEEQLSPRVISLPADSAMTLGWISTPTAMLSSLMNVLTNALPTKRQDKTPGPR